MCQKVLTAITYARKSVIVKGVTTENSVNYQQVKMDSYAKDHKLEILKRYSDVGYTGISIERPELMEMLSDLEKLNVDFLLVYSVDRFGRDLRNNIETMLKIIDKVKHVIFITENISSTTEYFKMFFLLLTAMSQEERERLLKRVADGRRAKVLHRLTYDGKYPLGYVKSANSDKIHPARINTTSDEEKRNELVILQYIFYGFLMKMSLRKIAKMVNEHFGPTKRGAYWNYKSVQYILKNKTYSGYLTGVLEKKHFYLEKTENIEPLIDPLFHQKIIKMLDKEHRGRKPKSIISPSLFCLCYHCGEFLSECNNLLECRNCNFKTETKSLVDLLIGVTQELIKNKYKIKQSDIIQKLVKQYELKINKLTQKRNQLLENKKVLDSNEFFESNVNGTLMKINTTKISEINYYITVYEEMRKRVNTYNQKSITIYNHLLIKLPYILVLDWSRNQIHTAFHPSVFNGGSSYEN